DARHIVTAPVADLPRADLVAAMTGDAAAADRRDGTRTMDAAAPAALTVRALTSADGAYEGVDFRIGAGEIVGLAGATGSGRTEVAETVVGLRSATGDVEIAGRRPR